MVVNNYWSFEVNIEELNVKEMATHSPAIAIIVKWKLETKSWQFQIKVGILM